MGLTSAEVMRRWRAERPLQNMVAYVRDRAKRLDVEFALTVEDIQAAWPRDNKCVVCREPMIKNTSTAPSVDRRDNSVGYQPGNIAIICRRCNMSKSDYDASRLYRLGMYAQGLI